MMLSWMVLAMAGPAMVPVQGYLEGPGGAPLNGSQVATFRITGRDGSATPTLVHEATLTVAFTNGAFTALLGGGGDLNVGTAFAKEDLWVTVEVDGVLSTETPIAWTPRAGFAARALTADLALNANQLDGLDSLDFRRAGNVPWSELSGVPSGLADGVDADTTYTNGAGLSLSNGQFSVIESWVESNAQDVCYDTQAELTGALNSVYLRPNQSYPTSDLTLDDIGADSLTTALVDINNSAADGGRTIYRSEGFNDWRIGNHSGKLRVFPGENTFEPQTWHANGTTTFNRTGNQAMLTVDAATNTVNLGVDTMFIPRIQRKVGSGNWGDHVGYLGDNPATLSHRVLDFRKTRADTSIRVVWSDNFRTINGNGRAQVEMRIGDQPCTDPTRAIQGLTSHDGSGGNADNHHFPATMVFYCRSANGVALGAGTHRIRMMTLGGLDGDVNSAPYVGWNGSQFVIEAQEVF